MQTLNPVTSAGNLRQIISAHAWLKSLGLLLGILWILPVMADQPTGSVTMTWYPSPSLGIAGYNVYYGSISGVYTNKVSTGNTTSVTLSNLVAGSTYFFAATCYNVVGDESPRSNEAAYTVPLVPTAVLENFSLSGRNFSFTVSSTTGTNFAVEASIDLVNWTRVQTNTAPFTFVDTDTSHFAKRFYRTVALR